MAREPVASDELMDKMFEIARYKLVEFDFDTLISDVQGDMCTYPPSPQSTLISSETFLQ